MTDLPNRGRQSSAYASRRPSADAAVAALRIASLAGPLE
jgi:hypothetical protein